MEILIILAVIAFIGWFLFLREDVPAPYKVEKTSSPESESVVTQTGVYEYPESAHLTPVLPATEITPVVETVHVAEPAPAKKPRKPRAPKVVAEKPVVKKAAPVKKAAAIKAAPKKPRSKKA
jgi:hypothetical protein